MTSDDEVIAGVSACTLPGGGASFGSQMRGRGHLCALKDLSGSLKHAAEWARACACVSERGFNPEGLPLRLRSLSTCAAALPQMNSQG